MHTQGLFLSLKGRAVLREPPFKMVFRIQNTQSFKEAPEQTVTTERSPQVCQTHTIPGSNSARRQENTREKKISMMSHNSEQSISKEHSNLHEQIITIAYPSQWWGLLQMFLRRLWIFFFFLTACNFTLTLSSQTHPLSHRWSQSCLESLHGKERRESLWASRRRASPMERWGDVQFKSYLT